MTSITHQSIEPTRSAIVTVVEGEAFADSRDIAAAFGKNHKDVLRAIRNLIASEPALGQRNFAPFQNKDLSGSSTSHYLMDRDGFTLLAMGFTGAAALKWKLRYIEAFKAMEAELTRRVQPVDLNDPAALRGLLLTYSEKAVELQGQVDQLAPKAAALQRIAEAEGSLCITDAAKALQMRPKDLFAYLRSNGWLYRRHGTGVERGYEDKVAAGLLEHKITLPDENGRTFEQVRVTPRGVARLSEIISTAHAA